MTTAVFDAFDSRLTQAARRRGVDGQHKKRYSFARGARLDADDEQDPDPACLSAITTKCSVSAKTPMKRR
jgi:hypothetical protein